MKNDNAVKEYDVEVEESYVVTEGRKLIKLAEEILETEQKTGKLLKRLAGIME